MLKPSALILSNKQITALEIITILAASLFPIFVRQNYAANVYLAWEGAYRLYLGQIPYRDFGLPMGYGFWIIPALFFKLFGPYLATLIKAQAFINILSALAFRSILRQMLVNPGVRLLSVGLYIISFSFFNIWPWYNHSVIVFEFIGIAFILSYITNQNTWIRSISLILGSFFIFLSFFTKQDAGALGFMIVVVLMTYHSINTKKILPLIWFVCCFILVALCFTLPFIPYNILYWFNYGQPPHSTRISVFDIIDAFFGESDWIKFYMMIIFLTWVLRLKTHRKIIEDKIFILFSILITGILIEAIILKVTSFTDSNNNIFFHAFAIAYIASYSGINNHINFKKIVSIGIGGLFIILWWSPKLWSHTGGIISRHLEQQEISDTNEVSIHTFIRPDPHKTWTTSQTGDISKWQHAPWKVFQGVAIPESTIAGIKRLLDNSLIRTKGKDIKVLNMTEITPLAQIIGYTPETGPGISLWYHKNVGVFEKQLKEYETKIYKHHYDLILFEYIPVLNNFYPFEIRDALKANYLQIDSFPAPRDLFLREIEIYVRKP